MTTFTKGDKVRENRQGSTIETVLATHDCVVETYSGNRYHPTKLFNITAWEALDHDDTDWMGIHHGRNQ